MLRLFRLPSLPAVTHGDVTKRPLAERADRLLAGDAHALDDLALPLLDVVRWLADEQPVLFHGSSRSDLEVLEPIRQTRDATEFGDLQAVYATSDPVWAIYFATLRRTGRFSTRNGSMGIAGDRVYPRWYFFSVNGIPEQERFGSGSLYVLPREGFRPQPAVLGVLDTAQWVSDASVRPLARLDVAPEDFPFRNAVVTHDEREPIVVTLLRAGGWARLLRRSGDGTRAR